MIEINNIFTVIDPSTDNQCALQRAMRIAKVVDAKIHAYLCISPSLEAHDPEALRRAEMARYKSWLENIVEQARAEGFEITSELVWDADWRNTLGAAAKRAKCDFIVKSSHRRSAAQRLMMTSSDHALLETANCPVQLVSSEVVGDLYKVLIAVDTKREDERYRAIFDSVVAFGKFVAGTHENGELHAVYAFSDSEDFEHVTDIAKRIDIDTDNVHVVSGNPEEAIAEAAREIDAQILVIGLSTKSTLTNRIFGHIVDDLLHIVENDVLIVLPENE